MFLNFRTSADEKLDAVATNVEAPIEADEEIVDNRVALETLMQEMVDMTGRQLEDTLIWQVFQSTLSGPVSTYLKCFAVSRASGDDRELLPDYYDQERFHFWLHQERLPSKIRRDLLEMHVALDDLSEHIAELSQTRWERLNHWSSQNV